MQSSPSPPLYIQPSDRPQAEGPGGLPHHWRGRGRVLRRGGRHPRRHCRVAGERALNSRKSGKKAPLLQRAPSSGQNWNNCPQLVLPACRAQTLRAYKNLLEAVAPVVEVTFTSIFNILADQLRDQQKETAGSAVESAVVDQLLDRLWIVS